MKYLSLFSGIEAASVAWEPLGWECIGVAEIEPFACSVLAERWPGVPNLGDITKITEEDIALLGPIDLIVFGSPCQDLSVAGKRGGLAGERSGLFWDAVRIVEWARKWAGCRWALWENVPGVFSSNAGRDFAAVVGGLGSRGVVDVPKNGWGSEGVSLCNNVLVEWSVLDAQWFGLAQRRKRVFALADFGDWRGRPPILLEPQGLRGNSPPSRGAGESVAAPVAGCSNGGGANGPGRTADDAESLISHYLSPALGASGRGFERSGDPRGQDCVVAHTLNAGANGRIDGESETFVTHALKAGGFDASEDGTGRGTPLVPAYALQERVVSTNTNAGPGGKGYQEDLAYTLERRQTPQSVALPLGTRVDRGGSHREAEGNNLVCFHHNAMAAQLTFDGNTSASLTASQGSAVGAHWGVRRLTPRECERLQGFPDDYTLVTHRHKAAADGPRYKALGNSMAVPVMRWIGERIDCVSLFQGDSK